MQTLPEIDKTIAGNAEGTLLAGRYRIVRQLGQGGMGSVWLAEDTMLDGKQFAIKMLPSILVSNKRAYRQLKDEALVAMRLTHPNIVTLRAFEENGGNPFLVMDYIDGQTLDDYLAEYGDISRRDAEAQSGRAGAPRTPSDVDGRAGAPCPPSGGLSEIDVLRILKPIAAALDYAHGEGVVHRDVKPANIMIRKDGHPFILDFGIAREIQETMTRVTGKLSSGTLLYMSPEQLNGDAPKPAQDVYSFAAMAYECMKGEPPFVRGAIEDQIKNKAPEPLVGRDDPIAPLAVGIMSGLAKKPEDRPPTCAAVLEGGVGRVEHVERVEGNVSRRGVYPPLEGGRDPWGSDQAERSECRETQRKGGFGKVLGALAFLAAVVAGGWLWFAGQDATPVDPVYPDTAHPVVTIVTNNVDSASPDVSNDLDIVVAPSAPQPSPAPVPPTETSPISNPPPVAVKQPKSEIQTSEPRKVIVPRVETATPRAEMRIVSSAANSSRIVKKVEARMLNQIDTSGFKAGEVRRIEISPGVSFDMVWCPPGEFLMGSPADEPERGNDESLHKARIVHGFWIGRTEVSQRLWKHVTGQNPSIFTHDNSEDKWPVDSVSHTNCLDFLAKLNEKAGTEWFRLPTEAEWEYACRAGSATAFCFGSSATANDMQVRGSRQGGGSAASGTYGTNAWGIVDMHGNLAEWCDDRYAEYGSDPGLRNRGYVLRGGSWKDRLHRARSAARSNSQGRTCSPQFGMRLCFSAERVSRSVGDYGAADQTSLALAAFRAGNWSLGYSFAELADKDDPDLQRWLGRCYDPLVQTPGFRIAKDSLKAQRHYARADELKGHKKGTGK